MDSQRYGIEKVLSHPLRRQAYQQIKDLIVQNKLRPNQGIVIAQLARELGMSHTPVREALIKLELDGLVEMERNRTPRVTPIRLEHIREMYQVRILLEGWAAEQAALHLSDSQLDELDTLLARASQASHERRYDMHIAADLEFHDMLIRVVDNGLFKRLSDEVGDQTLRLRSLIRSASTQHIAQSLVEHSAIFEALRAHDPELSRARMVAHLEAALLRTLETCEREANSTLQTEP